MVGPPPRVGRKTVLDVTAATWIGDKQTVLNWPSGGYVYVWGR
jgi:hypothetical protein